MMLRLEKDSSELDKAKPVFHLNKVPKNVLPFVIHIHSYKISLKSTWHKCSVILFTV